jgi:hypothetical protein
MIKHSYTRVLNSTYIYCNDDKIYIKDRNEKVCG